jgi:nicotinamidase-related amidase
LRDQQIERVVLVGQVTEQCILYSALDAYVRHLRVAVPRDGVAGIHDDLAGCALRMMERNMRAQITCADDCPLA